MSTIRRRAQALLLALLVTGATGCSRGDPHASGLVVEEIQAGRAADRAGLVAGDRPLSWRRGEEGGWRPLEVPQDLDRVLAEQVPLGGVHLLVERASRTIEIELPQGAWGANIVPARRSDSSDLPGERALSVWRAVAKAEALRRAGEDEAAEALRRSAEDLAGSNPGLGVWLFEKWGDLLAAELQGSGWTKGRTHGRPTENGPPPGAGWPGVVAAYEAALARSESGVPPLTRAAVLQKLGWAQYRAGEREAAAARLREAYEERIATAPGSWVVADSLRDLADLARVAGNLTESAALARQALTVIRRAAPESPEAAGLLIVLARALSGREELDETERLLLRAETLYRHLGIAGREAGSVSIELGEVRRRRGHLAQAEQAFLVALDDLRREAGNEPFMAWAMAHLAEVARARGDLAAAEDYYRRTVDLHRAAASSRHHEHLTLFNLGELAFARHDLSAARAYYEESLEHTIRLSPNRVLRGGLLCGLGRVAALQGDYAAAAARLGECEAFFSQLASGGLDHADAIFHLAAFSAERGELERAESLHRKALAIRARLAPGTAAEALSLHAMGLLARRAGRHDEGLDHLSRAVAALEAQRVGLGERPESHAWFSEWHASLYRDLIAARVEAEEVERAFHTLEQYRARAFLIQLADRGVVRSRDLPPELARARERRRAEHRRVRGELEALDGGAEASRVEALLSRLREIHRQQDRLTAEIRRLVPRVAALEAPRPLDYGGARAALGSGTLLLSYSVGPASTHLFIAASAAPLRVVEIESGEAELRQAIERLRLLLARPSPSGLAPTGLLRRGEELYQLLVAPAAREIAAADRLLILPDGPLHLLPFGALVRRVDGAEQFLVAWKPLHVAASATVYGYLRRGPSTTEAPSRRPILVAFGAPTLAATGTPLPDSRVPGTAASLGLRRSGLAPLPASRTEATALAGLYGRAARLYLGREATEGRAKTATAGAHLVHFAAHALLDERLPLESAIALAPQPHGSPAEDGLLQAWEVLRQMRLDADLVTLSACETALGEERAGEGLLGLTQAFQHAGARSVVASLWRVDDRSTAALMARFYAGLKSGLPKDEALRRAQLELLRAPVTVGVPGMTREAPRRPFRTLFAQGGEQEPRFDASHPHHWAAFQLYGDWR